MFKHVAAYQSFNAIPSDEWSLRGSATQSIAVLRQIIELHIKIQGGGGLREKIADHLEKGTAYEVGPEADRLYDALFATKRPHNELAEECIGHAASLASVLTLQTALLIDLFLSEGYESYKARIVELAHRDDEAASHELQGLTYEGMRHTGIGPGIIRIAASDMTVTDGVRGSVQVLARQKVLAATAVAAMDPTAFPSPEVLDPTRPREGYAAIIGPSLLRVAGPAVAAMLKEIFKLDGIGRAKGDPGQFVTVEQDFMGLRLRKYLDSNARESPWPTNMMLNYHIGMQGSNGTLSNGVVANGTMTNGSKANGTLVSGQMTNGTTSNGYKYAH
jgi:hypothetical protein